MPSIRYAALAVCLLPCFSSLNSAFAQDTTVPAVTEESLAPDIETTDPRVEALKARYQEQVKELSDKLIADIEKTGKISPPSHLEFVAKNRGSYATMRKWFDDKATSFVLKQISLVPLSPQEGKWYWEAQYGISRGPWEKELTVAIRMDGEILTELD
jgi:hypothetical protein